MLYEFGGIFGGAHTWRGLFSEFYSMSKETMRRVRLEPMPGPPDPELIIIIFNTYIALFL